MYKLNEKELKIINKVSEITSIKYDIKNQIISFEDLIGALEDMINSYENKQEELEDLKKDIEENYKRIPVEEQYGV